MSSQRIMPSFKPSWKLGANAHACHLFYPIAEILFCLMIILGSYLVLDFRWEPIGRASVEVGHDDLGGRKRLSWGIGWSGGFSHLASQLLAPRSGVTTRCSEFAPLGGAGGSGRTRQRFGYEYYLTVLGSWYYLIALGYEYYCGTQAAPRLLFCLGYKVLQRLPFSSGRTIYMQIF